MALSGKASLGGTFPWWSWGEGGAVYCPPMGHEKLFVRQSRDRGVELTTCEPGVTLDLISKHSYFCPLMLQHRKQFSPCGCCGSWSQKVSKG